MKSLSVGSCLLVFCLTANPAVYNLCSQLRQQEAEQKQEAEMKDVWSHAVGPSFPSATGSNSWNPYDWNRK